MARAITTTARRRRTVAAWLVGFIIFFPILWMILDELQDRARGLLDPAVLPVLRLDDGELRRSCRSAATICITR